MVDRRGERIQQQATKAVVSQSTRENKSIRTKAYMTPIYVPTANPTRFVDGKVVHKVSSLTGNGQLSCGSANNNL